MFYTDVAENKLEYVPLTSVCMRVYHLQTHLTRVPHQFTQ